MELFFCFVLFIISCASFSYRLGKKGILLNVIVLMVGTACYFSVTGACYVFGKGAQITSCDPIPMERDHYEYTFSFIADDGKEYEGWVRNDPEITPKMVYYLPFHPSYFSIPECPTLVRRLIFCLVLLFGCIYYIWFFYYGKSRKTDPN